MTDEENKSQEKSEIKNSSKTIKPIVDFKTIIGYILILFVIFLVFKLVSNNNAPKSLQEYHQLNLQGKLDPDQGYIYNGYSFVYLEDRWNTQLTRNGNVYNVHFYFDPKTVENLTITGSLGSTYFNKKQLYISIEPEQADKWMGLSVSDLSLTLSRFGNLNPIAACAVNKTDACINRPIINCDNKNESVIYFSKSKNASVKLDNNCIRISGNGTELLKVTDRLLFDIYNII